MSGTAYRILVLADEMRSGGGPRTIVSIARGLAQAGHHVAMATQGGPLLRPAIDAGIAHYRLSGARLLPVRGQLSLLNMIRLLRIIRRERPDIIHCFQHWALCLAVMTSICHRHPLVFTNNTITPRLYGCRISAYITATSPQFARFVARSAGVPSEQVTVIANRIDLRGYTPELMPSKDESRERLGLPPSRRVISFISRFRPGDMGKIEGLWRFLAELPSLCSRVPELFVVLAGIGSDCGEVRCKCDEVNRAAGSEVIRSLGVLPQTLELIAASDMVVGTGRCIMEAMACWRPTAVIGHAGYAGLVDPSTIGPIADANFAGRNVRPGQLDGRMAEELAAVLNDAGLARSLSEFGRHYTEEELDVQRGVEKYEAVYRRAVTIGQHPLVARLASVWDLSLYLLGRRKAFPASAWDTADRPCQMGRTEDRSVGGR